MKIKGRVSRVVIFFITLCLLSVWLSIAAHAEETDKEVLTMPPDYANLPEYLPEEMESLLPDGLFSSDPEEALAAAREGVTLSGMVTAVLAALGLRLSDAVGLLATLVGLLLLSCLLGHLNQAIGGRAGELSGFVLRLCVAVAVVSLTVGLADRVADYLQQLCALCGGMIPVMGGLYVMGGSLSQATVGEGLMLAFLNVLEYLCAYATPAVCGVCMALALLNALGVGQHTQGLGKWLRKTYTGFLGFVTFLLSAALGCQSVLAAHTDNLRMKGLKYAVGNLIPIAGGGLSGSLGTLAAGIDLLRSVCGVCGILLLALLFLPVLVELLLFRQVIRLAAVAAEALALPADTKLLEEIAELYGYMVAAVSLCSVFFLLALCVLITSGSALG